MSVFHSTSTRPRTISPAILAAAALAAVATIAFAPPPRLWTNTLLLGWFLAGIGLAGPLFVAIHDLSGARWHEPVRPMAAVVFRLVPVGSALAIAAMLFGGLIVTPGEHAFRALWLSKLFFFTRAVVYAALWLLFGRAALRRRSSAAFIVIFAFTVWLASTDWIMALDGGWASTIFGVYHFAGLFSAGIALMAAIAVKRGCDDDTLHDLGKLLFAFSTFWMYIWFSQFMLIWYGNMPEESGYFAERLRGNWGVLFVLNVLLNWVVPFVALMPAWTKRSRTILFRVAVVVLAGHWLDLYLSVFPSRQAAPPFGPSEVLAGAIAILLLTASRRVPRDVVAAGRQGLAGR